jgi:LAO/AO transport system kinase
MIALGERGPGEWRPRVVKAVAARGEGIDDVVKTISEHWSYLDKTGELRKRREERAAAEIEALVLGRMRARIGSLRGDNSLGELAAKVAAGVVDPYSAAEELLSGLG